MCNGYHYGMCNGHEQPASWSIKGRGQKDYTDNSNKRWEDDRYISGLPELDEKEQDPDGILANHCLDGQSE